MRTDLDNDDAGHAREGDRIPGTGAQPRQRGGACGATQASDNARGSQVIGYARDRRQQRDQKALSNHEGAV